MRGGSRTRRPADEEDVSVPGRGLALLPDFPLGDLRPGLELGLGLKVSGVQMACGREGWG